MEIKDKYRRFANNIIIVISSHWSFLFFFALIIIWFLVGAFVDFNEAWQSILHLSLSIITFLLVLLIEHIQHRENKSMQLKLDTLIKGVEGADNQLINIQEKPKQHFDELQQKAERTNPSPRNKQPHNKKL